MVVYPRVSAQVLGEGKFGIVRRGLLMPASLPVAVKTILKNQGGDAALFEARDEVEMMHEVAPCLHISAVHGAFEDQSAVHIVSPIYSGGELFDRIVQWHHSDDPNQVYTERMAAVYTKQLFLALERSRSSLVPVHQPRPISPLTCPPGWGQVPLPICDAPGHQAREPLAPRCR